MSLPSNLLRTKKLDDLKCFNNCGDDLLDEEILLNDDIELQFAHLPGLTTRKKSNLAIDCVGCEKLSAKILDKNIVVDDLQKRLKDCEIQNTKLLQEKTDLAAYVAYLEQRLANE